MGPVNARGNCTWMPPLHVVSTALNGCSVLLDICQWSVSARQTALARYTGIVNCTYDVEANLAVLRIEEDARPVWVSR